MPKRTVTPPGSRKVHHTEQAAAAPTPGGTGKVAEVEHGSPRPSSPFPAISLRRTRFSSVPLVELKHADTEEITFPASVELPRRHVTFYSDVDSDSSLSGGGLCSMSDTMESFKDVGGSPSSQPSVRIKHLTRNSDGTSRFPKLDECAHFHYDNVELGPINVVLSEGDERAEVKNSSAGEWWFCVQVTSNGKSWQVRRSIDNFQMLDRQLHRCVYDRKFSLLPEISIQPEQPEDALRTMLTQYLERFSQLAGSLINCGPVLNWLELDNRGNRLIVTDEAAINTPAIAAAYVIKRYASQATDEISLEVGDIISVIDMPPPEESSWWRGKKGFQVGFFPCECVEIIGDKVPQSIKIPKAPSKPVLRKHGKLIAFFRSFLLSRPSRRKLKQSGILKERVFGCDLGEHLMNTGRDIPLVLKCCAEFIEQHGIVDGIYRLSGVTSNIQKLRLAFDEDRVPNLMDEAILQDIHCVASLLKMYFRELPNPLLTFHLYDKFVNAVQADEDMRLLKLRDVVQQLPPPHYRSLEYLMRHLSKVAAHGFQTGMTPKNVAIVWAPNLLRSRDIENGGVGALHVVGVQAVLTEYLIRYTDIIFNEKMPIFPSPIIGEETPKKTRPKSLAISTPTKLLSLEEARSRALTSNLPGEQQKFIDVGGGEENLPIKYHTVIELPSRRRSMGKSKKSPLGWRSFFSRGWHTTSGRRKNRRPRSEGQHERPKIGSPIFSEHSPLALQDKAVTESDVSHTNTKKLRAVKSAESLFPLTVSLSEKTTDYAFSPADESITSPPESFAYNSSNESHKGTASPSKSVNYQKHVRSTSHDSYFERIIEFPTDDELEQDDVTYDSLQMKYSQKGAISDDEQQSQIPGAKENVEFQDHKSLSLRGSKVAQKQKLVSFETEASSPKLQKLSLKRLYNTLSSPPLKKKEAHKEAAENSEKQSLLQHDAMQTDDVQFSGKCSIVPQRVLETQSHAPVNSLDLLNSSSLTQKSIKSSVPLTDSTILSSTINKTVHCAVPHEKDTIAVEIHRELPDVCSNTDGSDHKTDEPKSLKEELCDNQNAMTFDDSENLISFSMEATISDSVSLSQLLSFESKNEENILSVCNSGNMDRNAESNVVLQDGSLTTPESPTGENVSEIPSSADSEVSGSIDDMSKQMGLNDSFINEVQKKHFNSHVPSSDHKLLGSQEEKFHRSGEELDQCTKKNADEQLVNQTQQLQIAAKPKTDATEMTCMDEALTSTLPSLMDPTLEVNERHLPLDSSFVENIILSPPENFVDDRKSPTATVQKQKSSSATKMASEIKASSKSPNARSLERSMTEVHEICPRFVSGIAVSGSFGHELFRANNDFGDSVSLHKKRSCSDKLSPISPIEESRRKFESEIGRLIVRDRQMKLEMEQMKAERQKFRSEKPAASEVKLKSEKKFVDAVDFRKSPIKSMENDRKKPETDDLLKSLRDSSDEKKVLDTSHGYSRYIKIENKPSVKELLSKFEGHKKQQDDSFDMQSKTHSENVVSSSKQSSSVFSNVQVVNHNFPMTSSKSLLLNFADSNQSSTDNQSSHAREHIFQTECVVRFPHPKTSNMFTQDSTSVHRNGSLTSDMLFDSGGSNSWTSGQSDHYVKVNSSKTAFLSSDNLMSTSVQPDSSTSFFQTSQFGESGKSFAESDQAKAFKSEPKCLSDNMHNGQHFSPDRSKKCPESAERTFSSFKDTYKRANQLTQQMRNEFLQRGLSQEKLNYGTDVLSAAQEKCTSYDGGRSSRSPTESRKKHASTRPRPKSVPPPVCRLSFVAAKQPPPVQVSFPRSCTKSIPDQTETFQNVPKTSSASLSNGKESSDASQLCGPPKRIRDRAAIFERSLSFSGYVDKKPFPSSNHSQKAQPDSSAR